VLAAILAACCACAPAFAYEFENAVPLTLGMQLGEPVVKGVHIKLQGHDVEIGISVRNGTDQPQYTGFYATTPLFEYLGAGEEYADKSFSGLKAFQDGKPLPMISAQRAYFLGEEITAILRKAGIDPLPSDKDEWEKIEKLPSMQNMRIKDWQGQVSFGWSALIAPHSDALETVRYSALPYFGLETLKSEHLTRLVRQHCGSAEKVTGLVHRAAPKATQVFAEVFEFPLPFVKLQDTKVTIEKPVKKGLGGRAIAAMACGFDGPLAIPSEGTIRGANNSISILVVSLLHGASEEESAKK